MIRHQLLNEFHLDDGTEVEVLHCGTYFLIMLHKNDCVNSYQITENHEWYKRFDESCLPSRRRYGRGPDKVAREYIKEVIYG